MISLCQLLYNDVCHITLGIDRLSLDFLVQPLRNPKGCSFTFTLVIHCFHVPAHLCFHDLTIQDVCLYVNLYLRNTVSTAS